MSTVAVDQMLDVRVSDDGMQAFVRLREGVPASEVGEGDVLAVLQAASITVTAEVRQRIAAFITQLAKNGNPMAEFLVAEGRAAQDGRNGRFEPAQAGSELPDESRGNRFVDEGVTIGRILPPFPGTSGYDVRWNELQPRLTGRPFELGYNVSLGEDGRTVVAEATGQLVCDKHSVSIRRALVIPGDLDVHSGVALGVDVLVQGTVREGVRLVTRRALQVNEAVEASVIRAEGAVSIGGGILGRQGAALAAGGAIVARFADGARIVSGGDATFENECVNSTISTEGWLRVKNGPLVGGEVYARSGMSVRTLGSHTAAATSVAVGLSRKEVQKSRELRVEAQNHRSTLAANQRELAELKELLQPTARHRERITELHFEIDQLNSDLNRLERDLQLLFLAGDQTRRAVPVIMVAQQVWPGVIIRIDERSAEIDSPIRGPVTFRLTRNESGDRSLLAVHPDTGAVVADLETGDAFEA